MPGTPRLLGAGRAAHATPEYPHRVFSPGEHGYHGPRETRGSKAHHERAADYMNRKQRIRDEDRSFNRTSGKVLVGGTAGMAALSLPLIPIGRHNISQRRKEVQARTQALQQVGKDLWHAEDPGIRHATKKGKVHNVTSMKPKVSMLERLGRVGPDAGAAIMTGGMLAGIGAAHLGIRGPANRLKEDQRVLRREQARVRRQRAQPVAKGTGNYIREMGGQAKAHFGTPKLAAATLRSNPQALAFGAAGTGALASGPIVRNRSEKVRRRRDVAARTVYGGLAGQAAYQGATYGSNAIANARHSTIYQDPVKRRGYKDPADKKIVEGHKKKHGLTNPNVPSDYKGFYRHFPTDVKGGRHLRINAHLTTGKRGFVVGAASTLAGAGLAGHHELKKPVHKALYVRETRTSPGRVLELGLGAGLAAWGIGRSPMIGRALGYGLKQAARRNNQAAYTALELAQAARGVLRRGTAPGERHLRQVQTINRAINAVPRGIRPEVATAAGVLLMGNATPVQRRIYRPINPYSPRGF